MGCNNCGSNSINNQGNCTSCNTSCCAKPCGPKPYYTTTPLLCPEDNSKIINKISFSTAVKSSTPFNMPSCGQEVQVFFNDLYQVATYSRIWAFTVGYLTILGFNPDTGALILRNECDESCGVQASPGTLIPECTLFIVSPPSCNTTSPSEASEFPYLAAQFIVPAVDDCIDISVTNVNGLIANTNVQIAGGTYLLSEIKTPTLIRICNNGAGGVPGTVVTATDCNGTFFTPIILIESNPCTRSPVLNGTLVVCTEGGQFPLNGTGMDQVPVLDYDTQTVTFKSLAFPTVDCTVLSVCLTLDPDHVGSYLVTVLTTENFQAGDTLRIGATLVTVDSIDSATTMHVTPVDEVVAIITYGAGTSVCGLDCCTQIIDDIGEIIADACVPQVQFLPVELFTTTISEGGPLAYGPSEDNPNNLYFEALIATLADFDLAPGCTWALEAVVDVAVAMVVSGVNEATSVCEIPCIASTLNELELVWNTGFAPTRTTGKSIWNQGYQGNWQDQLGNIPGNAPFITKQLIPASPQDNAGYHGDQIQAIATELAGGTNMELRLFFRSALPSEEGPMTVSGVRIMASGFIKVWRV